MIKHRIGIPLLALMLVAAPGLAQASATLHFVSAKRTSSKHAYKFSGYFNYIETEPNYDTLTLTNTKSAERVGFYVDGTYYPESGMAVETMSMVGAMYGTETVRTTWGCTDDPWLNPRAKCSQERSSNNYHGYSMYLWGYCSGGKKDHWCFAARGLVPQAIAQWVRHGPPAPKTSGPAQATDQNRVRLTAHYARGTADRVVIQQWYCPTGKNITPTNTPGDTEPFGGACSSTVTKPLRVSAGSSQAGFLMAYPRSRPKAGTWYVRTRLSSNTYGDGVWGDWHRTVIAATVGRVDRSHAGMSMNAHRIKVSTVPKILAPREGQVFHGIVGYNIRFFPHSVYTGWLYSVQWKRARIVTAENLAHSKPGHTDFPTAPMPWKGADLNRSLQEAGPVLDGAFPYSELRPNSLTSGYQYWFRIREQHMPDHHNGPWSAWRSFIVQEPVGARVMSPSAMHVQPGAHFTTPSSSGQQQNSHQLAPRLRTGAPTMMRRTQHKTQQHNAEQLAPMPMMRVR